MLSRRGLLAFLLCFGFLGLSCAHADAPAFDLLGPKIDVHVQRHGRTLPIAQVPWLESGDRLWIHPDFPPSQSAHYILIVAFLRGATNPPPDDWFHRVDTLSPSVRQEGIFVNVPPEAQHALLFLAPATNGDFSTLRAAVRGRPGAFVRAAQDLQQASWDRLRLNAWLAQVRTVAANDPSHLKQDSELAARTLGMRLDQECFDKPTEQQAPCLSQHTDGIVLDDSNAQSRVTQLANGSAADLMNQLSYSTAAGGGVYSPYVGAIVDVVRIFSSVHTAKYQYIPALALPLKDPSERPEQQGETLNLRLNVPPSFRDPKSVIVVALPPVLAADQVAAHLPLLQPVHPAQNECALAPNLVLQVEGAPLVFASSMASGLTLHVQPVGGDQSRSPAAFDIPLQRSILKGGFTLQKPIPLLDAPQVTAQIHGLWGYDTWQGPSFNLTMPQPDGWTPAAADHSALIIGRTDTLHLNGANPLCVQSVEMQLGNTDPVAIPWKHPRPDQLELSLPLKNATPGEVSILVHQYGLDKPQSIPMQTFAEAAALDSFQLNAGDTTALLRGNRLDEVRSLDMAGITFAPSALHRVEDHDQLTLNATGLTSTLQPSSDYLARVQLRDGRELHVKALVAPPRPQLDLLSKSQPAPTADTADTLHLGSASDFVLGRKIVFFLRSRVPAVFPRQAKIEVAASDGSFQTMLSLADGSLMLEDAHTAVATLDPLARFGPSAFGPIQMRVIAPNGVAGDWIPLGSLIRFPQIDALHCYHAASRPCTLTGNNLFLITAIGTTPEMANAQQIAPEFAGNALTLTDLPHTDGQATLYLHLRDDPQPVQAVTLAVTLIPSPVEHPARAARNAGRHPAADAATDTAGSPASPDSQAPAAGSSAATGDASGSKAAGSQANPAPAPTAAAPTAAPAAATQPAPIRSNPETPANTRKGNTSSTPATQPATMPATGSSATGASTSGTATNSSKPATPPTSPPAAR